ncbi:MAG: hypothetical protein D6739_10480, partial [Nitrospirae bacterium]
RELSGRLDRLQADRARLVAMLQALEAQRRAQPTVRRIAAARGQLPWPVEGEVVGFFGVPEGEPPRPARGIRIRPRAAGPVRAVWDGEVVFADRFEGYGLLLILDHGSGYYSVYGHAAGLLVGPGDRVRKGQVIAEAAGPDGEPLYFEIRDGGRPVDPLHWLVGLAATATAANDD